MSQLALGLRAADLEIRRRSQNRRRAAGMVVVVAILLVFLRVRHLRFEPGAVDFPATFVGRTAESSIAISLDGNTPVEIDTLSIVPPDAPFEVSGCSGSTVTAAQPCRATITFRPLREGASSAQLVPRRKDGAEEPPIAIRGLAQIGNLAFEFPRFGEQIIGEQSPPKQIAITNRGAMPIGIARIDAPDTRAFRIAADGCTNRTLPPGARCVVDVVFQPPSREEFRSEWLILDETNERHAVLLAGRGLLRQFTVSTDAVELAETYAGKAVESSFAIVNDGDVAVAIASMTLVPPDAPFTFSRCQTLRVEERCDVSVAFRPQTAGVADAQLRVQSGDGTEKIVSMRGVARAVDLAFAAPDATAILGERTPTSLEITNRGALPLRIDALDSGGNAAFSPANDGCTGTALPPGGACTSGVLFAPQQRGANEASWTVTDETSAQHRVTLTGRGLLRHLAISPPLFAFPATYTGKIVEAPLSLANDGDVAVAVEAMEIRPPDAPFATTDCAGSTIAPNGRCTAMVGFLARSEGRAEASLVIRGSGGIMETIPLRGAASPVELSFTKPELRALVDRRSAPAAIEMTNHGRLPLRIASIRPDGNAPFRASPDRCLTTLQPGGTCSIGIVFMPRTRGTATGTWTVVDETGMKHTATAIGYGLLRRLAVSPEAIRFPELAAGKSDTRGVLLSNEGDVDVTITAIEAAPDAARVLRADIATFRVLRAENCVRTLAPRGTCEFAVEFRGRVQGESRSELFVRTADGPQITVPLSGSVVFSDDVETPQLPALEPEVDRPGGDYVKKE